MRKRGTDKTLNRRKQRERRSRSNVPPLPGPLPHEWRRGRRCLSGTLPRASLADSLCPGLFIGPPDGAQKRRASGGGNREGQDRAVGETPTAAGETPALPKNTSAP